MLITREKPMPLDLFGGGTNTVAKPPVDLFATPATAKEPVQAPAKVEEGNWRTGNIAPIAKEYITDKDGKMHDTGEWKFAVPEMINGIIDAIKLPGEVMRGEVDPNSEEGFDRTMNLATMGISPLKGAGGAASKVAGEVVKETVDSLPAGVAKPSIHADMPSAIAEWKKMFGDREPPLAELEAGLKQGFAPFTAAKEAGFVKPIDGSPPATPTVPATLTDQELDSIFAAKDTSDMSIMLGKGKTVADKLAELAPEKQEAIKLKQAERIHAAAKAGDAEKVVSEVQRSHKLGGNNAEMSAEMQNHLKASTGAIEALGDPEKVKNFVDRLNKKPKDPAKPTSFDMVFEAWLNGLLSGPQTHVVNVASNAAVNLWGLGEEALSTGVSKLTGSGASFNQLKHRLFANFEAVPDALRASGAAFRTEKELFDTTKLDTARVAHAIPGPVGKAIRLPGRALNAEDAFFKTLGYRQEIAAQAAKQAETEGLKGQYLARRIEELRADPTDEMVKAAEQYSKKQTFTEGLGKLGRNIQGILKEKPVLRVIVPFFRTPVNLLKYSAERSPAAFAMKETRDALLGRKGSLARDKAWTKMTMGTAVAGWAFNEALKGNITGSGAANPNRRKLEYANDFQPYSIKFGDTWYSYGRFEPMGTLLGIAADMATLSKDASDTELDDIAALVTASIAHQASSKTWLKGPSQFAEAFNSPKQYLAGYIKDMAGTVIPAGIAQYSRTRDPYMREAETIMDGIKARIPGYRETLAIREDVMGQPIKQEGGLGPDLLSPIYMKAAKTDPTIAEMLRLKNYPGRLQKNIGGVDLTPDEWHFYSHAGGVLTKQYMDAVVAAPVFKELPDDIRHKVLADAMNKARDMARDATKAKFPDLFLRIGQAKYGKMLTPQAETDQDPEPMVTTE